jgi:hypothetical protein
MLQTCHFEQHRIECPRLRVVPECVVDRYNRSSADLVPLPSSLPIPGRSLILQPSQRTKTQATNRRTEVLQTTYPCTFERLKGVRRRSSRGKAGDRTGRAGPGRSVSAENAGCRDYSTLQVHLRHLSTYIGFVGSGTLQRFIKTLMGLTPPFIHPNGFSISKVLTRPFRSYPTSSIYPVCHVKRCASVDVSHLRGGLSVAPAGDIRQHTQKWGWPEILGRNVFFVRETVGVPP